MYEPFKLNETILFDVSDYNMERGLHMTLVGLDLTQVPSNIKVIRYNDKNSISLVTTKGPDLHIKAIDIGMTLIKSMIEGKKELENTLMPYPIEISSKWIDEQTLQSLSKCSVSDIYKGFITNQPIALKVHKIGYELLLAKLGQLGYTDNKHLTTSVDQIIVSLQPYKDEHFGNFMNGVWSDLLIDTDLIEIIDTVLIDVNIAPTQNITQYMITSHINTSKMTEIIRNIKSIITLNTNETVKCSRFLNKFLPLYFQQGRRLRDKHIIVNTNRVNLSKTEIREMIWFRTSDIRDRMGKFMENVPMYKNINHNETLTLGESIERNYKSLEEYKEFVYRDDSIFYQSNNITSPYRKLMRQNIRYNDIRSSIEESYKTGKINTIPVDNENFENIYDQISREIYLTKYDKSELSVVTIDETVGQFHNALESCIYGIENYYGILAVEENELYIKFNEEGLENIITSLIEIYTEDTQQFISTNLNNIQVSRLDMRIVDILNEYPKGELAKELIKIAIGNYTGGIISDILNKEIFNTLEVVPQGKMIIEDVRIQDNVKHKIDSSVRHMLLNGIILELRQTHLRDKLTHSLIKQDWENKKYLVSVTRSIIVKLIKNDNI